MYRFRPTLIIVLSVAGTILLGCPLTRVARHERNTEPDPHTQYEAGVALLERSTSDLQLSYSGALASFVQACQLATPHVVDPEAADPQFTDDRRRPEYFYNAGWAAQHLGQDELAEQYYLEALALDPTYTAPLLNLAHVYTTTERPRLAADLFEQKLAVLPDDVPMMLNLAGALSEAGDLAGAEHWVQRSLDLQPGNETAYKVLAHAYYQHGEYDMALLVVDMAAVIGQVDADSLNTRGLAYLRLDEEEMATQHFTEAVALDPQQLQANLNLGYLAFRSGDYPTAASHFTTALAHHPGNLDAQLGLAVAYRGVADFDSALAQYDAILAIQADRRLALINKAMVQDLLGDFDGALGTLHAYESFHGVAGIESYLERVEINKAEWERQQEQIRLNEGLRKQLELECVQEAGKLEALIARAELLYQRYGARANEVHFTFNQVLDDHVTRAQESLWIRDDPAYIRLCSEYLEQFIVGEYLPAIEEPVEVWQEL